MHRFIKFLQEAIRIPTQASYGNNAPEFNDRRIRMTNEQDFMMKFFGIRRDFYYSMFEYEGAYFLVGMGNQEGKDSFRLVMGASDKPSENWKDYSFAKQFKRSGFLWLKKEPKIEIRNMRGLYGRVGYVAIQMIKTLNPPKIFLNGYTPRMTELYKGIFDSEQVRKELEDSGYTVRIGKLWIILEKA